jgi:7,8-dihydro-6-hydroxymethylpterin dimethyltransferase
VLLEVTERCDLECPVCFAQSSRSAPADPSIAMIEGWYRRLLHAAPGSNVQLSGGEPTMRDDLPRVIALGRDLGLPHLQLNTNGLRIAAEDGYAGELAAAGLRTVFLQFDGVDDAPYVALRGRRLATLKERTIERCAAAGLGVVLVPTVVRGVNLDQLGRILDFALDRLPAVRGLHLQPLALLGRYPASRAAGADRVTLPDVMRELAAQSRGRVRLDDLAPGDCEHALCSFSREYLRRDDGSLAALRREPDDRLCGGPTPATGPRVIGPADKAAHVARRWSAAEAVCCGAGRAKDGQWQEIVRGIHENTFSVSGMAFQDAWTIDLERLRHCYLHVLTARGSIVPFCAYNLTATDGHGIGAGRSAVHTEALAEEREPS